MHNQIFSFRKVKTISKSIGGMMKEGKKEEAEAAKEQVAEIKKKDRQKNLKKA